MKIVLLLSVLYCLSTTVNAQTTYFQQDFSSGNAISNYVDATNPGTSKFTGTGVTTPGSTASVVSTITIVSGGTLTTGALETYRPTDLGGATNAPGDPHVSYDLNFSPEPTSFYLQFTFDGSPSSEPNSTSSAVGFYVGASSRYGNNGSAPTNSETFARLNVNIRNTGTSLDWALRWVNGSSANSPYFTGKHLITWVLNRAGGTLHYLIPITGPASETLANGKWDAWVDGTRVFDEVDALAPAIPLLNFKYIHTSGTGRVRLDDFLFRDVRGLLPVRLTDFRAVVSGTRVDLNWQLPVPVVGSTFAIERSREGYDYAEISRQQAIPDQRYFTTIDAEPLVGLSYYRLRHISPDSSSTLSTPVSVQVQSGIPGFSIRNNPSSGERITLITNSLTEAAYQLTTLTGQPIPYQLSETPDGQVTLLPQRTLLSGVYVLTATTGAIRLTRRVLVH